MSQTGASGWITALLVGFLSGAGCGGDGEDGGVAGSGPSGDPSEDGGASVVGDAASGDADAAPRCRVIATRSVIVDLEASPILAGSMRTCSYDGSTFTFECATEAGTESFVERHVYRSLDDFVADGQTIGGQRFVEGITKVGEPFRNEHDADGRLTETAVDRDEDGVYTDRITTYTVWDEMGRPTLGEMSLQDDSCTSVTVTVTYADHAPRSVTFDGDFLSADGCGASNSYATIESYDDDGVEIGYELQQEGHDFAIGYEVEATETLCEE